MSDIYTRRQAIALGVGSLVGLSALGLAGCGGNPGSSGGQGGPVELQLIFWGSATRNKLTQQAIGLFQKGHQDVKISSQFTDFNTYWTKLNTQIAGGATPDLIQMDMRYVAQYVRKGLLMDLTQFISKQTISLSDFDPMLLNSSKVNNTVYGIPLGGNYQTYIYDKSAITRAGVGVMPENISWDDFGTYTAQLTKALGNGMYGTADNSVDITSFEVWIRQHGKEVYTRDGGIGFDQTDVAAWFDYWNKLRQAGSCPPMNIQSALDVSGTPTDSSVIKGKAVFTSLWSNQITAWQAATQRPLGMAMLPTGSTAGMYLKASMLLSISASTKHPNEAASFTNFLINDPDGVKAITIERGVPGSKKAQTLLAPTLSAPAQVMLEYMSQVSQSSVARAKEVLDPPAAGQIADSLRRVGQAIGFGKVSVQDGAKSFYADAQKAVAAS
jgi:multiple sugar transport system substrate-binding protein